MNPLDRVVIIGAGPAGSSLACMLARAGVRVCILESKAFPRVKVCGEYVSPAGTDDLEALLPPDRLVALGARRVGRFALVRHDGTRDRYATWTPPAPAWALSRASLDEALLAGAREAGADVRQPATVRSVAYRARGATVSFADGSTIEASLVVHADGSGRHDPNGPVPASSGLIGLKCHARLPAGECDDGAVHMRAGDGQYVGCVRVEGEMSTVALCAKASLVREFASDHDAMVARCWPSWSMAWRTTGWLACPVPRSRFIAPGHVRSFRIGNAAAAVDPVGGEGIASAIWSGRMLARLLLRDDRGARGLDLGDPELRRVHRLMADMYAARLRTRLPACRFAAELLMRPRLLGAIWPALAVPGLTIGPWYSLTGKPPRDGSLA